jgi:hypothetical protein
MPFPPPIPTTEEDDEASIPTEHAERNGPHGPFLSAGYRKAAKRNFPFDLKAGETIQLALSQPLQAEGIIISANKRARLEDWTLEEDAKLTSAVAKTHKKTWGKKLIIDWAAVATLVLGRTRDQCRKRWCGYVTLGSTIDPTMARASQWTTDEDNKLKDAVRAHGGKNWKAIAAFVPGHTREQCCNMNPATARLGQWTAAEDKILKNAVTAQGARNWEVIIAFLPGRTLEQCRNRWHQSLVSNIDPTTARAGRWTADEDEKLREAVEAHGAKNWKKVAARVPGRTKKQCCSRWHGGLVSNINPTMARAGKWTADEDEKLKDWVREYGEKNWKELTALVPGRTKNQCCSRWHSALVSDSNPTTARASKWAADEDKKLRDGVRAHGGKNWKAIAAFVPGRTWEQCCSRWHDSLVSIIDPTTALAGRWTAHEDKKLKDGVRENGGKNWVAVAALVPGRTKR